MFTWGASTKGQLGLGNFQSQYTPQIVSFNHIDQNSQLQVRDIEAGEAHTVAILGKPNWIFCEG
jgi:alpha-tubulin suppressor-like RCC1 family protein